MSKIRIVSPTTGIRDRLEAYTDIHFSGVHAYNNVLDDWADQAYASKSQLGDMLGLPGPDSGLLFPSEDFVLSNEQATYLFRMVYNAEMRVDDDENNVEWVNLEQFNFDLPTLTYKNGKGKQQKLLRQLRKAPQSNQEMAFQSLCRLIDYPSENILPDEEGNYPFEKFWPKLGDLLKAKNMILVTPDPVMLLGSGMFKNTQSCHRPGGEYEKGPFTYAFDSHTIGAYILSASDVEGTSDDALLTPYREYAWKPDNKLCARVLGRAMYHVHDPHSYRLADVTGQMELIKNANFVPDLSSCRLGGKLAYVVQTKSYGVMNDALKKEARHVITKCLRESKGIPVIPWKSVEHANCCITCPDFTYQDSDAFVGKYIQVDKDDNSVELESMPEISLGEVPCPFCNDSDIGDCDCVGRSDYCSNCNCGLNTEVDSCDWDADGNLYCSDCFYEAYSICENCDEAYPAGTGEQVHTRNSHQNNYSEHWCEHCCSNHATSCHECDFVASDNSELLVVVQHRHGEVSLCNSCYEEISVTCVSCDIECYPHMITEHDGGDYCEGCMQAIEEEEEEAREEAEKLDDSTTAFTPKEIHGCPTRSEATLTVSAG